MDVHKPKPVHGWRGFLGEIGIIVIGVLIALAAEQAVEALHWRHKVAEAEAAMRLELRDDDLPQAYARVAITPCLNPSLDAIQAMVETSGDRARVAALTVAYKPLFRTWDAQAWQVALASDAASHMSPSRMIKWSIAYRLVPIIDDANLAERSQLSRLRAGGAAPGQLSPLERERILTAVQDLRASNNGMYFAGLILLRVASDAGVRMTDPARRQALEDMRTRYGSCVATPPSETRVDVTGMGQVVRPGR